MPDQDAQLRRIVLGEHNIIRNHLAAIEACGRRADVEQAEQLSAVRWNFQQLTDSLLRHLAHEELLLRPILDHLDAWGPVRLEQLESEHRALRLSVAELGSIAACSPGPEWFDRLRLFAASLEKDMESEEHDFLPPNGLHRVR